MLIRVLVLLFLRIIFEAQPLFAQSGEVQGWVRAVGGRAVPAALVALTAGSDTTALRLVESDVLGRFRIRGVAPGEYLVRARSIGFRQATAAVTIYADATVQVELTLEEAALDLPGVEVNVERARAAFQTEAGATRRELSRTQLKLIPGVVEADVLRALEVLPGVVSTSDYSSAFNVRGGSADQNLILLDGVPVYNPFHLGGLFSVFNADVVARAEMLAGGFPAQYGSRVASVLNVESDASGSGTDVHAGVSLLATRVALGADLPPPVSRTLGLRSGRARFSLRRSYFDQLLRPFVDFPYHLIDAQMYVEGWTHGGRRLSFTGYTGRDVLDLARSEDFPLRINWGWGNDLIGTRFTVPMSGGRALDLHAGFTRFTTQIQFPEFGDTDLRSEVRQFLLRADLDLPASEAVTFRTGVHADHLAYDNLAQTGGTVFAGGKENGWLGAAYAQATLRAGDWLLEAGLRADGWQPQAADAAGVLSPRLAVKRFFADGGAAVKLAAGRYSQFIHSLRDEELPIGIDVWVLSGSRAPHTVSDQVQLGVESFLGDGWSAGVEAYGRWFDGVVTNNFAEDPGTNTDDLIGGTGLSYGADLFVRRDRGRLRPAFAVSWLRATRKFEDPTLGIEPVPSVEYPPIFDRRLDVELVVQALLPREVQAGLRWNLGSGLPYTRPLGGYTTFNYRFVDNGRVTTEGAVPDELSVLLGERNATRYPTYHRLDVSVRKAFLKQWGQLTPYLELVNVYDRRNVLFYFYEFDRSPPVRSGVSMFPFLPTLGVEVSF